MTVRRDALGIPHVRGGSLAEVCHEQGRATAQDRAWQLEVERRRGEGTSAELLGPGALEWDLLARRARLADVARRAHARLSPEARAMVAAYADGVNAGLADATSPELAALGIRAGRWEAWAPLVVFAVQHLLFSGFPSKLWRRHLASVAGEEALGLLRTEGLPGGSNAVAVAGSLAAGGLPIVAGDPHRLIEAPGCYAQVRLACTDPDDGFDVTGLAFVGVPGVQHFAHAGSVAWGVTNAVADDEDLYVEELARHGETVVARGRTSWEPVARRLETVRVRQPDGRLAEQPVEVLVTDRGPVVLGGPEDAEAISLRTPAHVLGDLGFDALPLLLRARTAGEVVAAFGPWVGPVDNLLVADDTGRLEHRVVGRVPEREPSRRTALRRAPGRGADGHGWTGWVTDLPARTGDVLVTANDRADERWDRVGDDFAPPHRARRIAALVADLAARGPVMPEQLGAVLADVRQTAGEPLLAAIAALRDLSEPAAVLRDRLLAWDREMAAGSVDAARFAAVREVVVEGFVRAPGLAGVDTSPHGELFSPWFDLRARVRLCLPALLAADKPFGADPLGMVAHALERVAAAPDPPPWGESHRVHPLSAHELAGDAVPPGPGAPGPSALTVPMVPVSGDDDCVLATRAVGGTGACVHGPVARYVWDLAGRSRWVVPLGASGDPGSPHHHDQQATWAAGGTLPVASPGRETAPR
ncbi:penicillin acylase family protein [Nocardioides sp. SYSU DS0651]|uniref:penicillin acylase family protein n=1 Tax=Nocardioides sp. SYSU DS0651 TaxID=3415955 RepID=UPI003F4B61C2